jgi:hypothetical protein
MFADDSNPSELVFWKNRLSDRTLLLAIDMYPDRARHIFGPLSVMRKDVLQLGMILAAREILAESAACAERGLSPDLAEDLRPLLEKLPADQRKLLAEATSPAKLREQVRHWARRILKEATGHDPG